MQCKNAFSFWTSRYMIRQLQHAPAFRNVFLLLRYLLELQQMLLLRKKCQWAITQPINHTNILLISVSEIINNTLVFFVKESKNAVKLLPLISICFEYPSFLHSKKMSERDHCMAICASDLIFFVEPCTEIKLLYNTADLFKSVCIWMMNWCWIRNH